MARQRRKAKEAKAMMELHNAKANHAAQKFRAKQLRLYGHQPVGTTAPMAEATTAPPYSVEGHHTGYKY